MYNYFIKTIIFTVCFIQFQIYAGKKVFSNKKNVSSSVSEALNQPKNNVMYDPIFESCLTTFACSQRLQKKPSDCSRDFQNESLKDFQRALMSGDLIPPRALELRSKSDSQLSSATSSAKSSFSKK
jgi:hypothetical protein